MQTDAIKIDLIKKIMGLKNIKHLKQINEILQNGVSVEKEISILNKPLRKKLDIEKLKKEQNFKPIDKNSFFKKMDDLNIQEPIEELLQMI